jgi:hypothetical protein
MPKEDTESLQASHEELKKQVASLQAEFAALKAAPTATAGPAQFPKDLILTKSKHAELSDADKLRFQRLDGTVINDPVP